MHLTIQRMRFAVSVLFYSRSITDNLNNMGKRYVHSTSKESYERAKETLINSHQAKILEAFKVLGSATADQVAVELVLRSGELVGQFDCAVNDLCA